MEPTPGEAGAMHDEHIISEEEKREAPNGRFSDGTPIDRNNNYDHWSHPM